MPECESQDTAVFNSKWIPHAIPGEIQLDGYFKIDHCRRYKNNPVGAYMHSNKYGEVCAPQAFLNETVQCDQFVFDQSSSFTIVEQWKMTCEENEWKLAFVGTAHFSGVIVGSLWMVLGDR